DLKLRQAMQLEIKQYHAQLGCTIVFVTHDQGEALALSDRIAVMGKGRIEQVDAADVIYDRPNSLYVAEFIGRTNVLIVEAGPSGPRIAGTDIALPSAIAGGRPGQGPAVLSLRPEKIIRAATARDGSILMEAQISEVLFQGDLVHYRALIPGGLKLQFQEHRSPGSDILKVGGSVRLAFDPEDALRL
ncbi:MAG: ABC transporter ATP-binding protein, partial [Gemmobacter sp.]|nr:ABC transporter ATP-binding protein [Gemmobacter sp.]